MIGGNEIDFPTATTLRFGNYGWDSDAPEADAPVPGVNRRILLF